MSILLSADNYHFNFCREISYFNSKKRTTFTVINKTATVIRCLKNVQRRNENEQTQNAHVFSPQPQAIQQKSAHTHEHTVNNIKMVEKTFHYPIMNYAFHRSFTQQ